ncbi:YaaC family protein [Neobacillus sp. PS3-34]|uniref:YaaC family protein n=1 Tax=Neobacillus sp. PS3-34 TaxID=3070678 RepID=UPI0027E17073|nr:YaaC family protein [Neobacillus sp. PS3-34]WML50362.1 YaaC family protein [Neobacillus sp. PS3-34]
MKLIHQFKGWNSLSFFFSAEYSQDFLKKCYKAHGFEDADKHSFEKSYAFLYYLEHGQVYYEQAEKAPLILKPILIFYGLAHLIKACILTIDPLYPENTSVLAHGVSARKRKKQNYQFFHDEVKFQKNGLFPFMGETMFHMKQLEGEKATMEELLRLIPEMDELFGQIESQRNFIKVHKKENEFFIPKEILDQYHMTENRFIDFLSSKSEVPVSFLNKDERLLSFSVEGNLFKKLTPFKYNFEEKSFMFPLRKTNSFLYPELMVHYLLLYNLSMIARYETEWWSELNKMMPNRDYPFIYSFLQTAMKKTPFLIYQFLMG